MFHYRTSSLKESPKKYQVLRGFYAGDADFMPMFRSYTPENVRNPLVF